MLPVAQPWLEAERVDPSSLGSWLAASLLALAGLASWLGDRSKADRHELKMRRLREVAWERWRHRLQVWAAQDDLTLPAGDPPPEDDE